jgi:HEAT repeat protein
MRVQTRLLLSACLLACAGCGGKSTDQLIEDLNSPQEKQRLIAVRLLQHRKGNATQVVPALIGQLKSQANDIRLSAAIGLGYFGDQAKEAIPALQEALRDRDARIREAAGVALSRIDPQQFPEPPKTKGRKK